MHSLGHACRKHVKSGEKVEKPSSLKDEVTQEKPSLQQKLVQASESNSTEGNTQTNKRPSKSSQSYDDVALDTSNRPVITKCSSQGSTEGEKTIEGKGEVEGVVGKVKTSVQDPDRLQDGVSTHSQGSESQEQVEEEKVGQWLMFSCAM